MSKKKLANYFPKTISNKQASDTGMAVVLILLLIAFFTKTTLCYKIAIPVLIVTMTYPMLFYPVAIVWLGFSELLGIIMSKIILTIVYVVLVVPVGFVRKLIGKDSLQLNRFKKGKSSVMKVRNYEFTSKDIEKPY
ncbi:MAG: hypothetical protein KGV59_00570 [Tenacibaculum sp.]|nr:hypothetical protein [Tenacibaculum sp.]